MDWRAASRSRSRASVMDWRPSSRSRSRSTFNRNRNPYEHASEIHSQAMLASGRDMPLQEQLLAYTQSASNDDQWPLSQYLSGDLQGDPSTALGSASDEHQSDQQEELVGLSSFTSQFSPQQRARRQPMGMSKSAFEYDQAIRTAAAYDTFASSVPNNQPLHLSGEVLPSSLTSQSGPSATLALSPTNYPKLPGISGPGLYDETRENFHPQYGYLPRRVRKTSFDHTVAQGSSAESNAGLLPPPRAGKVSRRFVRDRVLAHGNPPRTQVRKRSADASPVMVPQNKLAPVSAAEELPLPTSASVNVPPGSFPNTAFTFSVPGSYEAFFDINAASGNTPNPASTSGGSSELDLASADIGSAYLQALHAMLDHGVLDETTRAMLGPNLGSEGTDPIASIAAIQAGLLQPENAFDFQQLMQQYLHTNATANPFTHINPTHVLGANSSSAPHPLATSGTLSDFSSPTGMSPSVHASQMPQNPGPTKPMPKIVGGKSISFGQKPQPVRSNSSPNLAALKLGALAGIKGNDTAKSKHAGGDRSLHDRQGHKSGPSTPSSEDLGGAVMNASETPTHCSNCQTTKTPLWRRDPEGQPLCNVSQLFLSSGLC